MMKCIGTEYMYSTIFHEEVAVLKYKSDDNRPYMECSRCGKMMKKIMYVIQSRETGVEMEYLGSECIKRFS